MKRASILSALLFFLGLFSQVFALDEKTSQPATASQLPKLHLVGPVQLNSNQVILPLAQTFREVLRSQGKFEIVSLDQTQEIYNKYGLNYNKPCFEFTCAYDAGNVMQAEYSMYGSISTLQDYYVYNFVLIKLANTKVVWSKVGEVRFGVGKDENYESLVHQFTLIAKDLVPVNQTAAKNTKGLLGFLDVSIENDYSKALLHRLTTQAFKTGDYDVVAQSEMKYLLESMEVKPAELSPIPSNMLPIGSKLGLDFMVYSKLSQEAENFKLHLSLYDIKNQKLVRDWPYQSNNFRSLLEFEDKFFTTLQKSEIPTGLSNSSKKKKIIKWSVGGVATATGLITGLLWWYNYTKFQEKEAESEINLNTQKINKLIKDGNDHLRLANLYGVISIASFASAGIVFFF